MHGSLGGLGIGSFGPVCLRTDDARYGRIGQTPKVSWRDTDLIGYFRERLDVPIALDTDVMAALMGERRWGAARGADSAFYLTVGTGIGVGALVDGTPVHGLLHPEVGHCRVPRAAGDDFPGTCPHHGDCVEGMAAGPAIIARWGKPLSALSEEHPAVGQTAHYLSHLLANAILHYAPERIVIGGGVMTSPALLPRVRGGVLGLLNGYLALPAIEREIEDYIVPPELGDDAGPSRCRGDGDGGGLARLDILSRHGEGTCSRLATTASGSLRK